MRKELLDEYISLYYNRRDPVKFRETYTRLSKLWIGFSDDERKVINNLFKSNY